MFTLFLAPFTGTFRPVATHDAQRTCDVFGAAFRVSSVIKWVDSTVSAGGKFQGETLTREKHEVKKGMERKQGQESKPAKGKRKKSAKELQGCNLSATRRNRRPTSLGFRNWRSTDRQRCEMPNCKVSP